MASWRFRVVVAGCCVIAATLLMGPSSSTKAIVEEGNWPQWRGPDGLGISEEKNLPTEWSATKNVRWQTAIRGRGLSSPIIWQKRVFLTTSIQGSQIEGAQAVRHVRNGGEWVHPDAMGAEYSYQLNVLCLDRDTGKILWDRTA